MRVARWGLGVVLLLAACGEPEGDTGVVSERADGPVAVIAGVRGKVEIRDATGAKRPAEYKTPLKLTDTLITAPDAMAVVLLANDYVLKFPDDQETPVRKFQHLGEPPASRSVQEMFREQLGDEYSALNEGGKLERIAGWNQLQSAGDTPAPEVRPTQLSDTPSAPPAEPVQVGVSGSAGAGATAASPDANTGRGEPSQRDRPLTNPKATEDSKKSEKKTVGGKKVKPIDPPPPLNSETAEDPVTGSVSVPDAWALVGEDGARVAKTGLPALLRDNWDALSRCGGEASELRVTVRGGVVEAVTPAACAASLLDKKLPEAGGGSATVVVRLR